MIDCPACTDWNWFGDASLEKLSECGTDEGASSWIHKAYRWLYDRQSDSIREKLPRPLSATAVGPHDLYRVPFPAINEQKEKSGNLLFLEVGRSLGTLCDSKCKSSKAADEAARFVFDLFRKMNPEIGWPEVKFDIRKISGMNFDLTGKSLSLAAIIGALSRILQLQVPDDIISTGCFSSDNGPKLETVSPGTITGKIEVAARFGYKRFFVVKGQKGPSKISLDQLLDRMKTEGRLAHDLQMSFIELSCNPILAVFQILKELPEGTSDKLYSLLVEFERKILRPDPCGADFNLMENCLSPFLSYKDRLLRHIAADILRRCLLHQGQTSKSEVYRKKMPALKPDDFPVEPLGVWLKYEEIASLCILDLDRGYWDDKRELFRLTERILDRIQGNAEDQIADIEEIRAAKNIANTRARCYLYRGRLEEDASLIKKAWNEIMRFQPYWDVIFDYASRKKIEDETFARQRNLCVDCVCDYRRLTGTTFDSPVMLWPENVLQNLLDNKLIADAFDLFAWFRGQIEQDVSISQEHLELYLNKADTFYGKGYYPGFLPFELPLRYNVGTREQQEHCREKLRLAPHLQPSNTDDGTTDAILNILAMRTAAILNDPEISPGKFRSFLSVDSPLRLLADQLLEYPEKIVFRCPY